MRYNTTQHSIMQYNKFNTTQQIQCLDTVETMYIEYGNRDTPFNWKSI